MASMCGSGAARVTSNACTRTSAPMHGVPYMHGHHDLLMVSHTEVMCLQVRLHSRSRSATACRCRLPLLHLKACSDAARSEAPRHIAEECRTGSVWPHMAMAGPQMWHGRGGGAAWSTLDRPRGLLGSETCRPLDIESCQMNPAAIVVTPAALCLRCVCICCIGSTHCGQDTAGCARVRFAATFMHVGKPELCRSWCEGTHAACCWHEEIHGCAQRMLPTVCKKVEKHTLGLSAVRVWCYCAWVINTWRSNWSLESGC